MTESIVAAFVPLVDCAVLVAAREQGFAESHGISLRLVKEPSWASLRDHLNLGHVDCAQALAPLPIAGALGIGQVRADVSVPFVLSRGGNAITLSEPLAAALERDVDGDSPAARGVALARLVRRRGVEAPLTLGMVYPFSGHNFELRYWLAAAGIHPDRDVRLVAIPPPLMADSLRAGQVDGFCVGEPWGSYAVDAGLGRIVVTKAELFPRGIEKVLAVRNALLAEPDRLARLLPALRDAARWADDPANHARLAGWLARPEYVGLPEALILRALQGRLRMFDGTETRSPDFLCFDRDDATRPSRTEARWICAQMARWGQVATCDAALAVATRVFRPDLHTRWLGYDSAPPERPVAAFDGSVFDADSVEAYVASFDIRTPPPQTAATET